MRNALSLNPAALSVSSPRIGVNMKIFAVIIILSFMFLLFFYVFQANNFVLSGYSLQNYQKTINKLAQDNENLEMALAQMGALENIESKISGLGFEKISKINYIQLMETSVASAK
jgi:hypothetical protein